MYVKIIIHPLNIYTKYVNKQRRINTVGHNKLFLFKMKLLLSSIVLVTLAVFAQSSVDNESNLRVLKSAKESKTPKSVKSVKVEKSMKSDKAKAAKSEKSAKAGVEGSKTPKGKGGGKGGKGKAVKSAKGENTKAAKSGKDVKSVKSRPCPDGKKVDDDNIEIIQENSSDKEAIQCFDTLLVTNMTSLFAYSDFNADLSSWDVSSVIEMEVSYQV